MTSEDDKTSGQPGDLIAVPTAPHSIGARAAQAQTQLRDITDRFSQEDCCVSPVTFSEARSSEPCASDLPTPELLHPDIGGQFFIDFSIIFMTTFRTSIVWIFCMPTKSAADQTPMPFETGTNTTYNETGARTVWIKSTGSGLDKRQATFQLTVHACSSASNVDITRCVLRFWF